MSMSSRYVAKTYGRSSQRDTFASRAFDDIFDNDTKPSTSKAASTIHRWGAASFTSTRGTDSPRQGSPVVDGDDRYLGDPFSFDSDDEGPSNPKRGMGYRVDSPSAELSDVADAVPCKPCDSVAAAVQNHSAATKPIKAAFTTYSRRKRPVSALEGSRKVSLDAFSMQLPGARTKEPCAKEPRRAEPRKFFRSRATAAVDHNYFHQADASGSESDKKEASPQKTDTCGPFDDNDVVDSEDSEITTDSPTKQTTDLSTNNTDSDAADSVSSEPSAAATTAVRQKRNGRQRPGDSKLARLAQGRCKKKRGEPIVRRLLTSPKKRVVYKAYNARQWEEEDDGPNESAPHLDRVDKTVSEMFTEDEAPTIPVLRRAVTAPSRGIDDDLITSVKVTRQHKPLFTVVRNVKQAHECLEHGETQDFKDDIDYIMDGLRDAQPMSVRCLSALSLASKCKMAAFRMHLRAHSTIMRIFSLLHNAPDNPTLALCTAAVMYLLSRDRLNMELEKSNLELMLRLLDAAATDGSTVGADYRDLKPKICAIVQSANGATKNSDRENLTAGTLAMDALLTLTSKRAGDWFKEDLRTLGGLDHIIDTVSRCEEQLDSCVIEPTSIMLETLEKIDRCLRVLENVTYLNSSNQHYLVTQKHSSLIVCLCRSLKVCENCMPFNTIEVVGKQMNKKCPGYIIFSCLLAILRVFLNLTHDNVLGCTKIGQQTGFVKMVLMCILRIPTFVPADQRFDLLVLGLGLLVNVVEHCDQNRSLLVATKTVICMNSNDPLAGSVSTDALKALLQLFCEHHAAARRVEEEHDAELERRKKGGAKGGGAIRGGAIGGGGGAIDDKADVGSGVGSSTDLAEQSGVWQESESGLQWVAMETDDGEMNHEDGGMKNGDEVIDDASGIEEKEEEEDMTAIASSSQEDHTDNFTNALHRMGRHMENSIVAAYTSMLVGTVIRGDEALIEQVRDLLPEKNFEPMIRMLKKFLGFMNFTSEVETGTGSKSIMSIIELLEDC